MPTKYILTIPGGNGSGTYTNGEVVSIEAEAVPGYEFLGWSVYPTNYIGQLSDPSALTTSLVMPGTIITLTPTYALIQSPSHYVNVSNSTPAYPYASWDTAATNIQDAVAASIGGDTIFVTNGFYLLSSEISVAKNISIQSINGPDVTIVDGGGITRCFNLGTSPCAISGLTITNGYSSDSGGGIFCNNTSQIVSNCVVTGNESDLYGGGMYNGNAIGCLIEDNIAAYGGGMIWGRAEGCIFLKNEAISGGGGMYSVTANNCTISGNTANSSGGGMYSGTANDCTISENTASIYGGGMYSGTADNCNISGNTASSDGGGMYVGTANNCTISGNTSDGHGGGVYNGTAENCTISGNAASRWGGGMYSGAAENCTINGNTASVGGGMRNGTASNCTISANTAVGSNGGGMSFGTANGCTISENTANYGGGMYGGTADNCTISGNTAASSYGGGMYNVAANNCTVSGNTARSGGGGMRSGTANNCVISGNTAGYGGGMYFGTANNCTISQNTVSGYGGGVHSGTANHCTIVGNSASYGGGMSFGEAYNSIIWYNDAASGDDLYDVIATNSCSLDLIHGEGGNITNAPLLTSVSRIAANSPCIGAGNVAYSSGTDLDGESWLNPPSMGCDEFYASGSLTGELAVAIDGYPVQLAGLPSKLSGEVFGAATMHIWDFGDGSVATNELFPGHVWNVSGYYDVVLSAFNDTYPAGVSVTQAVQVVVAGDKAVWDGNGHFYQVIAAPDGITWVEAKAEATARGGYLATPVTADENAFIFGMTQSTNYWNGWNGRSGPWLGGLQVAGGGELGGGWAWDTGEAWYDESWYWQEPNNSGGTENRIQYWASTPGWNDAGVDVNAYGYVVEFQIHESATGDLAVGIGDAGRIAVGYPLMLAARLGGMATRLEWDFADGVTATNTHYPVHAWDVPGEYDVVLTAFNSDHSGGISATQTVQVLSLAAGTIHVSTDGNDANDGLGWGSAKATIGGGVDAVPAGGTVWVSNGTYAVTETILVEKNMEIRSVNGPDETVVDGMGSNRCFHIDSGSALLSGFTVTNGYSAGDGGGLVLEYTSAMVSNCVVVGNTALVRGGGVVGGTLHDCMLEQNTAGGSGGGAISSILYDCVLARNEGGSSGGGAQDSRLYGCSIWGNSTLLDGGGVAGSTEIADCRIFDNYASRHGGGVNFSIVRNSYISENECASKGGGAKNSDLVNCTLTGNVADQGGGIWQDSSPSIGDAFNSIVFGNSATNGAADVGQASGTVKIIANSCASDIMDGVNGNITNAPLFADADGHLQSSSPCINWGNNAHTNASFDLDGHPRIVEGYVDMGCYEFQGIVGKADSDEDGLLDEWERRWFGGNVLPGNNSDGDGQSNGEEYVSGTDPTNAFSFFTTANAMAEVNGTNSFVLEWVAMPDRLYSVLWATNLTSGFQTLETGIELPKNSYTDTVHSVEENGYYKVDVRLK
ncbi:right-handed parallel beta-helix repeat-containing protein [Pontiellaceae bacterium B1224]|nr:right-handed parallel beta-helix repeat-containing protein [Pontiellaceae bacterium B1224]